jgi:PRC-barrel domain
MYLSDLLRSEVIDSAGKHLGKVEDVRVTQDGPLLLPFGAAFRVEGLVVGSRGLGTRLGYGRGAVSGPWLLRKIFAARERRSSYVPWDAVAEWDGRTVRLESAPAASAENR